MREIRNIRGIKDIRKSPVSYGDFPIFKSDLVFDWYRRLGYTLKESVAGADAEVVGGYVSNYQGAEYINYGNEQVIKDIGLSEFTIDIWFKTGIDVTSRQTLIQKGIDSTNGGWLIEIDSGSLIYIAEEDNTGAIVGRFNPVTIAPSTLYNFRLTTDRIANLRGFLNGVERFPSTVIVPPLATNIDRNNKDLFTGKSWADRFYFTGDICCVNIYNTYMPTTEDPVRSWGLNGNAIDRIDGGDAIDINVNWNLNNSDKLPSTLNALDNGFYHEILTGLQVPNPQYPLPVGWEAKIGGTGIFHNGIDSFISTNPTGSLDPKFDILNGLNQTLERTDSSYWDDTDVITQCTYFVGVLTNEMHIDRLDVFMFQADKEKFYSQMKVDYCNIDYMSRSFVYATQKIYDEDLEIYDGLLVHEYINNTCRLWKEVGTGAQNYSSNYLVLWFKV